MKLFTVFAAAHFIIATAAFADSADQQLSPRAERLKLNHAALDYARQLIAENHVVNDKHGTWREHRLSAEEENAFLRDHGFQEYSRWHLAIDESHRHETKAHYKFPFGDYKNVHRCALIAAQNRARQYHYSDIERAAAQLLRLVESKRAH
jgi:hypothetical protein